MFSKLVEAQTTSGFVSITFDDSFGYQYTRAFPLLQEYGFNATFYVITGYLGEVNATRPDFPANDTFSYMTVPELQQMQAAGKT